MTTGTVSRGLGVIERLAVRGQLEAQGWFGDAQDQVSFPARQLQTNEVGAGLPVFLGCDQERAAIGEPHGAGESGGVQALATTLFERLIEFALLCGFER